MKDSKKNQTKPSKKYKKIVDKKIFFSTVIKHRSKIMFLAIWQLFAAIFIYFLILEGLKKMGLVKAK